MSKKQELSQAELMSQQKLAREISEEAYFVSSFLDLTKGIQDLDDARVELPSVLLTGFIGMADVIANRYVNELNRMHSDLTREHKKGVVR